MRLALVMLVFVASAACAETLYKSVGADGKVTYSDQPAQGSEKAMRFPASPAAPLPDPVLRYQKDLQKGAEARLSAAAGGEAQFFMAQWCGYCRQAKAYLNANKISYREYDVDTPEGKSVFARLGGGGIPVLVWNGQRVNGFSAPAYDNLFRGH